MKIKSIRLIKLDNPIPVYDIEVPDTHNFALESGVVVHNSKDLSDALCGAMWDAQKYYSEKKKSNIVQHQNVNEAIKATIKLNKMRWASDKVIDEESKWLFNDRR